MFWPTTGHLMILSDSVLRANAFNLGDFDVTVTIYHHLLLSNAHRKHPAHLYPPAESLKATTSLHPL